MKSGALIERQPQPSDVSAHEFVQSWGTELLGNDSLQQNSKVIPVSTSSFARSRASKARMERQNIVRDELERNRRELNWLARHRAEYAGRWIALLGDQLVATGISAREVYAAIGTDA